MTCCTDRIESAATTLNPSFLPKSHVSLPMTRRTVVTAIRRADHHAVRQKQRRKLLIVMLLLPFNDPLSPSSYFSDIQNVFPERRKQKLRVEVVAKLLLAMIPHSALRNPLRFHQRSLVPQHQHIDRPIERISIRIPSRIAYFRYTTA